MLETLKSLWAKWKVQVSVVGGVLVIATTYGTCSYEPQTVSEAQVEPATETTSETTAVPVSNTDDTTVEGAATETETTTAD